MATDERPPAGAVIDRLLAQPHGFNLFQAISLLERADLNASDLGTGDGQEEALRLRAVVSLGFQPSDVTKITFTDSRYELATAVMSLSGAHGPLPLPFTEMVLERVAARDRAMADFLDIFNHRLLSFLYRSRKKHHVSLQRRSPLQSSLAVCLDALSNLGLQGVRGQMPVHSTWLRHAGLVGGVPRSMTGLLTMISDRLQVRVQGRQFCGAWRSLEPRDIPVLSTRHWHAAPRLGKTAVLGTRVWDQSAGIRLTISHLTVLRFRSLLKGGKDYTLLRDMVLRYLQQDVTVEVELQLDPKEVVPTVLTRKEPPRLGLTSWLLGASPQRIQIPPARYTLEPEMPVGA